MAASKKYNYESLVNRKAAISVCFIGMAQLFVASFLVICAFVTLSGLCDDLSCQGVTDGLGFWLGFPLMIPALLSVLLVATRHRATLIFSMLSNLMVAIVSIIHVVFSYKDDDYWKDGKDLYEGGKCHLLGFKGCFCDGSDFLSYPFRCDLFQFGYEINWIMFGLGIASIALTFIGLAAGVVGFALQQGNSNKERK